MIAIAAPAAAFTDVPVGHPYATAIGGLGDLGIISGYNSTTFGINDPVKRAQFSKMIVGTLGITPNASTATRFTDLGNPDGNGYPHRFVQTAYDNGITYGTNAAQTLFAPWNNIRRDQVVSMIVRGANNLYPGSLATPPAGYPSLFAGVPEPHGLNLRIAEYNGLLGGLLNMGSGWYGANATRGEVAQMLWNLIYVLTPPGVWVYADGTGDYPTIEAAVADIDPGTTIYLGPGIFGLSHTLYADFSFNLVGSGMDGPNATIIACAADVLGVGPVSLSASDIAFMSTATNVATDSVYVEDGDVEFTRCAFYGGHLKNDDYGNGLSVYGTATAMITSCNFSLNDYDGIAVWDSAYVDVYDSVMEDNGDNGIGFYDDSTGIVDQSNCTSNEWHGVSVNDYAEVTVQNSICSGNGTAGGDYPSGIYFEENTVGTVTNCECNDNLIDGISCHDYADVVLTNNTCNYNGEDGITLSEFVTGMVSYCECSYNATYDGIDVHDNAQALVENNLCVGNEEAGIWFGDGASGTIRNNECANNYYGLLIDLSSNPVVYGNILYDNVFNYVDDAVWLAIAAAERREGAANAGNRFSQ